MKNGKVKSIREFYTDKSILISGGTGFLGKTLIEKLLRSCDGVKRIFVLLRGKKGKSAEERTESFKKEVVFQVLRKTNPAALDKLIGIETDLSSGSLTLPKDAKTQAELQQINIIFHCAASVRFDDPLKKAIMINVCATKAMLDFAKTLSYLDVFMHVSTAYSNCDRFDIDEKIYPAHVDWRHAIKMAESLDEEILNALSYKFSTNMANTYVFTKHIAESMVDDYKDVLPIVLYRPSVVTSAEQEPLPGFIDSFNGPIGLLVATSIGVNRTSWQSHTAALNATPVDICIKGMIIAAVQRTTKSVNLGLPVYNAASIKTFTYLSAVKQGKRYILKDVPPNMLFWRPGGRVTQCFYEFYLRFMLTQVFPAIVADMGLRLLNKKAFFLKLQRALINAQNNLHYFMNHTWEIKNDNFLQLNDYVPAWEFDDFGIKELYPEYVDYGKICLLGARRFLLNWPDEDLEKAKKNLRIAILVDRIFKYAIFIVIFWVLYKTYLK